VLLVLFMTLPSFEPIRGQPMMDMSSSAPLPQLPQQTGQGGMSGMTGHSGNQTDHSGGQMPSTGHSGNQTPSSSHNGNQAGHSGGQMPSTDQRGNQSGSMDSMQSNRESSFVQRFTFASGYVALIFLGLTLLIGPANLLLRRRN